jgi:hypothetical protein
MKVFVVFDEKGQIKGTVVAEHDQVKMKSSPGTTIHVVDKPKLDRKSVPIYLRDLHRHFRVEVLGEPKLVRRKGN